MKVLHVAAEIFPFVKTGGLADVVGALPQALLAAGASVRIVLPGFPAILKGIEGLTKIAGLGAAFGAGKVNIRLGTVAGTDLRAYVVDAPYLYDRPGNPYLDNAGNEWADNLQRFALLSWVAAHIAAGELDPKWQPDVLHAHDWHAAMACAYKASHPASNAACVYTIHNLAYQGLFSAADFHLTGLPARYLTPEGLEFHGGFSFMKAGITFADRVTTVSPTYAQEIATEEFGNGLDGLIRSRRQVVSGILNGVDRDVWSPISDPHISATYSPKALLGKAHCKAALQQEMNLSVNDRAPLFAVVSRLTSQKGLDLLLGVLPELIAASDAQIVIQGQGDEQLEAQFANAAAMHPNRIAVHLGYDEARAHRIISGADALVVPSRFEPCGLTQMYGLSYGSLPLVHNVGGLADTVIDCALENLGDASANGFVFTRFTQAQFNSAVRRAFALYATPKVWAAVVKRGMQQPFNWPTSAAKYVALYAQVLARQQ